MSEGSPQHPAQSTHFILTFFGSSPVVTEGGSGWLFGFRLRPRLRASLVGANSHGWALLTRVEADAEYVQLRGYVPRHVSS